MTAMSFMVTRSSMMNVSRVVAVPLVRRMFTSMYAFVAIKRGEADGECTFD